jgi:hypothetical protein
MFLIRPSAIYANGESSTKENREGHHTDTEEVERYYAEDPERRSEPQRKQTKLRKVGAIVGWTLKALQWALFYFRWRAIPASSGSPNRVMYGPPSSPIMGLTNLTKHERTYSRA